MAYPQQAWRRGRRLVLLIAAVLMALGGALAANASELALGRNVRRIVQAATGGQQTPWDVSSLTDAFYFRPGN